MIPWFAYEFHILGLLGESSGGERCAHRKPFEATPLIFPLARPERCKRPQRQSILGSQMISANGFLGNWKTTKSGNKVTGGYKTLDQPGCYVIVTSPSPDGKAYENVYVGQSLHVCSRVRNHLTGHGNGDVYADVRNGKPVFVKIVPCSAQQMNDLERDLIRAFNATSSYNSTAGGSRRRF